MIYEIIQEFNETNSTNDKIEILKKYKDNELLKRVLKMTYDNIVFNYYVRKYNKSYECLNKIELSKALDILENKLNTREVTGHKAIALIENTLKNLSQTNAIVLEKILDRDLKINIGKRIINKVHKNLITNPIYMRCSLFSKDKMIKGKLKKGTFRKIDFSNAILQKKADGTFRMFKVIDGEVECISRSGEKYNYPIHNKFFKKALNGFYIGELTIKNINRSESNGLLNSDNPPHEDVLIELWDYLTLDEYSLILGTLNGQIEYKDRLNKLKDIVKDLNTDLIQVIHCEYVHSVEQVLQITNKWMSEGLEGGVLKNGKSLFKNGTSKEQLKIKLELSGEFKIVGFKNGKINTKRANGIGSIEFESKNGKIKGFTSGMSDAVLKYLNKNKDNLIGKIIEIKFTDVTIGKNSEHYALQHPRLVCIRDDKIEADDYDRIIKTKNSAFCLK